MKRSELKNIIKEEIASVLSEEEKQPVNIKYKREKIYSLMYSKLGYTKEAIRAINKFKTNPITIKDIDLSDVSDGPIPSNIPVTLSNGYEYNLGFNYDAGVWWIYDVTGRKKIGRAHV